MRGKDTPAPGPESSKMAKGLPVEGLPKRQPKKTFIWGNELTK